MIDGLYQALAARARGRCECQCGRLIPPAHADHFFGRAKAEETEFNVWLLSVECDYAKTNNRPSAGVWLERFMAHCARYAGDGYRQAQERAHAKLDWLRAKGTTR